MGTTLNENGGIKRGDNSVFGCLKWEKEWGRRGTETGSDMLETCEFFLSKIHFLNEEMTKLSWFFLSEAFSLEAFLQIGRWQKT